MSCVRLPGVGQGNGFVTLHPKFKTCPVLKIPLGRWGHILQAAIFSQAVMKVAGL
jgi:hypothetical protein